VTIFKGDGVGVAQAVERGLSLVIATFDTGRALLDRDDDLLSQMHDGLEEIVIEPHLVVEHVKDLGVLHGIQAIAAQVSAYQG
jgi:hypothetical protein